MGQGLKLLVSHMTQRIASFTGKTRHWIQKDTEDMSPLTLSPVVAGAANSPIPRSVILDLERRGFIVYVVASSRAEEQVIKNEAKAEVLALHLDVTNVRVPKVLRCSGAKTVSSLWMFKTP